jgi:hypothetical protein
LFCSSCPVLAESFWLSCSGCTFLLYSPSCPVPVLDRQRGEEYYCRDRWKESEGKRQRATDKEEETERRDIGGEKYKRQRDRDRREKIKRKRQRGETEGKRRRRDT